MYRCDKGLRNGADRAGFDGPKNGHFCRPVLMGNRLGWASTYQDFETTDSATFFTSFFIQTGFGASQMSKIMHRSKNLGLDPGGRPELDAQTRAGFATRHPARRGEPQ